MNLNVDIIADELEGNFNIIGKSSKHIELLLEHFFIFTGEAKFLPGKVYIGRGSEFPPKPFFEGASLIISIGAVDKCYKAMDCDYIELSENTDFKELTNYIQEIFNKYCRWYVNMHESLSNGSGVQELLNLTLPMLGNPIYFHDKYYHFIAHAEMPDMPGGKDIYNIKKNDGRFSIDALNILKNTPYFEKTFETTRPTYHIDVGECCYIYYNVRSKGKYWGRLFIDERVKPFKKKDYAIIGVLGSMIEKAILNRNLFPGKRYRLLEQNMVTLLDGNTIDTDALSEDLELRNWGNESKFFCFLLNMDEKDIALHTIVNTCEQLESKLENCITFPYANYSVGIVKVKGREKTLNNIKKTIKDFKIHAGVSLMFFDFRDFPSYYKQAEIALKYGMKECKTEWTHCFEEFSFSYMLDCCTQELAPEMLFPPILHKLMDHDKKKSTNYAETLRAYLENDLKPAKAMKALFVQRSTFLYRLERIKEIINIDFDDEKIKLHLLISFQLADRNKKRIKSEEDLNI